MGRHSVFRFWEAELPEELCRFIIREGSGNDTADAGLQPDDGENYTDENIRKTQVFFWDASHWISGLTMHYAQLANQELWNYRLSVSQGVQFGYYDVGGTYDWHKDEFDQPFADEAPPIWQGLSRKLSISVNLSDPDDYEGGDLMFKDTYGTIVEDPDIQARIRKQGSVVVFPAYTPHTVTPITRGVRCSLVSWIIGPPFS